MATKKVAPIIATNEGSGDFEIAPAGVYLARCYKMVDVGTQDSSYKGIAKKVHQVYFWWELLQDDDGNDVRMENGEQPFSIFKQYTLSMNEKANLRADLDSWRGVPFTEEQAREFDITKLLDKFCKLQVVHKKSADGKKTYANVNSIMTTKKTADGVNEIVGFSIANPDMEVFESFPDWLKDKIRSAQEWAVEADPLEPSSKVTPENVDIEDLGGDPVPLDDVPF